jgi:hypothetical protein
MAVVYISPVGGVAAQFFTNTGAVLTGGKLYTYAAGTTTPQTSYTTSAGNVARTNPIILDAAGRVPNGGEIWITSAAYKFVLTDSTDVLIATYDNVAAAGSSSYIVQNFTGTGAAVNFTLSSAPNNENSTFVYINGIYQNKNTYSVSGVTLIFSEAPPVTSKIEVMYL